MYQTHTRPSKHVAISFCTNPATSGSVLPDERKPLLCAWNNGLITTFVRHAFRAVFSSPRMAASLAHGSWGTITGGKLDTMGAIRVAFCDVSALYFPTSGGCFTYSAERSI